MLFAPPPNKKSWLRAGSRSILDQSIHYLIKYFQCSVPAKKLKYCHGQHYRNKQHRDIRSHFFRLQHRSCSKIFESGSASGPDILNIWESDSCSDFGDNDRSNPNLPMFLPKKWPHRLLVLPKWKSDSGSGSGLKKIWLFVRIRVRKKNAESCWSRLKYSGSGPTSETAPTWKQWETQFRNTLSLFCSKYLNNDPRTQLFAG